MKNKILFILFLATLCSAVWVDSDSGHIGAGAGPTGMFSVGVPPDPPASPDVIDLLFSPYRVDNPDGGYINIYIDGKIYSSSPIVSMLYPDSATDLSSFLSGPTYVDSLTRSILTSWFIESDSFGNDSIGIVQTLRPYEVSGSAFCRFKWRIHNYAGTTRQIGLLLFWDLVSTLTGITLPGGVHITESTIFPCSTYTSIPTFWEYEYSSGEFAYVDISAPPNTPPDRFLYCDIHDNLGLFWDYRITMPCPFDDATSTWWFPMPVPPDGWIEIQTTIGHIFDITAIAETPSARPSSIALSAYPNPFNSSVRISFCRAGTPDLPADELRPVGQASVPDIEIFDIAGRRVAQLPLQSVIPDSDRESRGVAMGLDSRFRGNDRKVIWTPSATVGSGVYLVRAKYDNQEETKRIVYLK